MTEATIIFKDVPGGGFSVELDLGPSFDAELQPTAAQLAAIDIMGQISARAEEVEVNNEIWKRDKNEQH